MLQMGTLSMLRDDDDMNPNTANTCAYRNTERPSSAPTRHCFDARKKPPTCANHAQPACGLFEEDLSLTVQLGDQIRVAILALTPEVIVSFSVIQTDPSQGRHESFVFFQESMATSVRYDVANDRRHDT